MYHGDPDVTLARSQSGSELLLQIYALTKGSIFKAIKQMDDLWKHESTREILDSEDDQQNIKLLSDDHVSIFFDLLCLMIDRKLK